MEVKSVFSGVRKVLVPALLIMVIGCSSTKERTVSQKEYDELLTKYNQLKNKQDPSVAIDEISIETVDVVATSPSRTMASKVEVETDLEKLNFAEKYVAVGNFEEATMLLKKLEVSGNRQVQVRAKFLLGEIMFGQQEYDLALQIFEDIIKNYSFSGLVMKTLDRLEVCSKKLKLSEKQKRYHSILYDFFES
ncbi:MAG: hypothetical protein DRQ88_10865 [Epsilonproteobacteria bacterium]|nr:MAG: hypothetical protein DRQ89_07960 [Campylobacterota bacterium]RLA64496.1 MAG: hypothetical protein DRQ88_10865 [Campylobacterota bacterium]